MTYLYSSTTSQQHSFVYDDRSKQAIVRGMDNLHVIIKIPFKRPNNFTIQNPAVWTLEKEEILWGYLSDKSIELDWDKIAAELNMTVTQVTKHSAVLYKRDAKSQPSNNTLFANKQYIINRGFFFSGDSSSQDQSPDLKKLSDDNSILNPSVQSLSGSSPIEEVKQLSQLFDQLQLEKPSHIPILPKATTAPSQPSGLSIPLTQLNPELEDQESEGSGIGTPFSEISEESLEHPARNEHYLSQLKNSAFSLFK